VYKNNKSESLKLHDYFFVYINQNFDLLFVYYIIGLYRQILNICHWRLEKNIFKRNRTLSFLFWHFFLCFISRKCNIARLYWEVIVQYMCEASDLVVFITVCSSCRRARGIWGNDKAFHEKFSRSYKTGKKNTNEYNEKTPLPLMCILSFQGISCKNTCTKSWNYRNIDILYGRRREQRQWTRERERGRKRKRQKGAWEIRVYQKLGQVRLYNRRSCIIM